MMSMVTAPPQLRLRAWTTCGLFLLARLAVSHLPAAGAAAAPAQVQAGNRWIVSCTHGKCASVAATLHSRGYSVQGIGKRFVVVQGSRRSAVALAKEAMAGDLATEGVRS
jgi:hypothetical protein